MSDGYTTEFWFKQIAQTGSTNTFFGIGYYDGSSSEKTVTTGFTPRFLFIKKTNGSGSWMVFDTLRGLAPSGNDRPLMFESPNAEGDFGANVISTTSTGFVMPGNVENDINYASGKYIYYAHA